MKSIADFAYDIRDKLESHLRPVCVTFRGSFATGTWDEYSDIDLQADVHRELNGQFYSTMEAFLKELYGPALVRYNPGFREDATAQTVRPRRQGARIYDR